MRLIVVIVILMAFILSSCREKNNVIGQQALVEASRQELVEALEERDRLLRMVKDISQSVDKIKQLEQLVAVAGNDTDENRSANARLVADVRAVRLTLSQRRQQLEELEEKLRQSGFYTDELREVVALMHHQINSQSAEIERLRTMLSEANERIGSLSYTVDSLSSTVISVSNELGEVQAASSILEDELNACYYIVATKDELKSRNIIETSFLRKTKILKGDFDKNSFIAADKRTLGIVPLQHDKVNILTNHPSVSYRIVDSNSGKVLEITDPEVFWMTSNILVVQAD